MPEPSRLGDRTTPSARPICRAIVTTADPVAERGGGRSAVAAEMMVGNAKPTPTPPMSQPGTKSPAYDGCAPTLIATSAVPAANATQPIAAR